MLLTVLLLTKAGLVTSLLAIADAWATASRMKGTAWPFGRPKALFPLCLCGQFQVRLPGSRQAKHTI